jgi:hypothetical protein
MMSGLSTPGLATLGPRDEKAATIGAGLTPTTVLLNTIVAVWLVLDEPFMA